HMNTPQPALTNVHKRVDGNAMVTGVFTVGEGSEQDMLVVGAGLGTAAGPARDVMQPAKALNDVTLAGGQSTAALARNRYPVTQWSFDLVAGGSPEVALMRIGSTIRLQFSGDYREPDG